MNNIVMVYILQGGSQKACISQIETRDYCNYSKAFHVIKNPLIFLWTKFNFWANGPEMSEMHIMEIGG